MCDPNPIDWKKLVLSEETLAWIGKLAVRHLGESGLAEEATTYVLEQLSKDDWHLLKKFKNRSTPKTYLFVIVKNLINEFSVKRYGKARPPTWLQRQGELAVKIWKLVCLERQATQTVIDKFSALRNPEIIRNTIRTIKARIPWCGVGSREIPVQVFEQSNGEIFSEDMLLQDSVTPEKRMRENKHTELLLLMNYLLSDENEIFASDAIEISDDLYKKLDRFGEQIRLTSEEKVVLKMVYQDGLKKNIVAHSLGMPAHLPGRILKRVFVRIHSVMESMDLNFDDFALETCKEGEIS
ncbi:MAG: hypothetical protein OEY38_22930 [Gammaproteobacteria bacterium]|nr:hypothetical protein [Gammaproteobacteria bacterium]